MSVSPHFTAEQTEPLELQSQHPRGPQLPPIAGSIFSREGGSDGEVGRGPGCNSPSAFLSPSVTQPVLCLPRVLRGFPSVPPSPSPGLSLPSIVRR